MCAILFPFWGAPDTIEPDRPAAGVGASFHTVRARSGPSGPAGLCQHSPEVTLHPVAQKNAAWRKGSYRLFSDWAIVFVIFANPQSK